MILVQEVFYSALTRKGGGGSGFLALNLLTSIYLSDMTSYSIVFSSSGKAKI